jgi:hypothetical protein
MHTISYVPQGLDMKCCPCYPTTQSRRLCAKYCVPSRISILLLLQFCQADFSGGLRDQADLQPSAAMQEDQPQEYSSCILKKWYVLLRIPVGSCYESSSLEGWRGSTWHALRPWTSQIPTWHSQRWSMYHPQHESEEYDSTQLRSTQSQVLLLNQLCQENPTLLEGSHQSILPAWWAASAELGGWSVHIFQPVWRGRLNMHSWQRQVRV